MKMTDDEDYSDSEMDVDEEKEAPVIIKKVVSKSKKNEPKETGKAKSNEVQKKRNDELKKQYALQHELSEKLKQVNDMISSLKDTSISKKSQSTKDDTHSDTESILSNDSTATTTKNGEKFELVN
ncbi:unnamed protein product [Ambrosiozyma monospora]|uniref:Unnamed protein product n=1 Tax=Ambrosiozyma monospora TaxID=43982 RepID=A0ACB5U7Q9_AMBMO|nr:unnamed protein product [Ambrosiozyma monospora]